MSESKDELFYQAFLDGIIARGALSER